ncbi:MAG: hypothetical protein D6737_00860 [Chloroflexi bacterium]|nr:MAG: hypothetical protein D6737_00860 [Chloroflexota bacterium]
MYIKSKMFSSKRLLTASMIGLMVAGLVTIGVVFTTHRQSLPLSATSTELGVVEPILLPVISTEDAAPTAPSAFAAFEDEAVAPSTHFIGAVQIPNAEKSITILLAGVAGCASCGFEAQNMSRLQDEYNLEELQFVFVDIYNFGGPDQLAWYANVLEATNLTWAIDADGLFKDAYGVDIDATLILNDSGDILYRDDTVTSYETLREQIDLILNV